jgi:ABC-type uncharacterized transport system ATPase subunit
MVAESAARETNTRELANAMVAQSPGRPGDRETGRPGKINAIVGVAGNGQTELAVRLRDEHPEGGHIPEDRTRDGIVAEMTIAENLALKSQRWSA